MKENGRQHLPYKLIARHLQSLKVLNESARGSDELSRALRALIDFLSKTPTDGIERLIKAPSAESSAIFVDEEVMVLDRDALEGLVTAPSTPRRVLEEIAIRRFAVPKGSMRSFQKVSLLREKLLILIDNERAHDVIGAAAKRSAD